MTRTPPPGGATAEEGDAKVGLAPEQDGDLASRNQADRGRLPFGVVAASAITAPHPDLDQVLLSAEQIRSRVQELGEQVTQDYAGREPLLVGVLKGAVMIMADLSRAIRLPLTVEFMALSSYGSGTSSSGVVRILKDLDRDIGGEHVLVVEDVVDSGLTLSWLLKNLRSRAPASVEVLTLLRKPDALKVPVDLRYVGFDIPDEFVVGYGLDHAEHYRELPYVGTLRPEIYTT